MSTLPKSPVGVLSISLRNQVREKLVIALLSGDHCGVTDTCVWRMSHSLILELSLVLRFAAYFSVPCGILVSSQNLDGPQLQTFPLESGDGAPEMSTGLGRTRQQEEWAVGVCRVCSILLPPHLPPPPPPSSAEVGTGTQSIFIPIAAACQVFCCLFWCFPHLFRQSGICTVCLKRKQKIDTCLKCLKFKVCFVLEQGRETTRYHIATPAAFSQK